MAVLDVRDLKVEYGAIRALKGISFSVDKGNIFAILGANGAGKSAALRSISGIVKPKSGEIFFEGKNIVGRSIYSIAKAGISHSPEGRQILSGLTVEENLKVGTYSLVKKNRGPDAKNEGQNQEYVYAMFPVLKERRKQQANTLSGGEQQMLAIGRALMSSPKILILDEPSLGLAPIIVKSIFRCIKEISLTGTTILIVEQNALQTLKIADYAIVLELGRITIEGKAQDLIHDQRLIDAYLGNKKDA
ncbi:MAG: ABC transporter ATP-binding protein [Spirochaetaceae bacterium]|jgi:branched-chain amino acid transport system ATP-binding protein|nr:ABC transporter ATP-binding protein [Spirochaetaceae bacterium]